MRVRILRGAHEIGGSCVELEDDGSRIVVDVGKPLTAGWDESVPLPAVPGLDDGSDGSLAGVVISHSHLDHYGLVGQVDRGVPVYIGREAAAVIEAARFFSLASAEIHPAGYLINQIPLRLGSFTVTPFLTDHSAYDAYSLVIEAGGRRLFYTGDIRGHGRKGRLFEQMLANPPRPIHVLLCEGTHIRSLPSRDVAPRSESDVELSMADRMRKGNGAVVVVSSAQNIDRLVTVYRACKRAGRVLVTDLYTATVADATGRSTIPQAGFPDYRVYIPNRQRVRVKESGQFSRLDLVTACRVFPEELAADRKRFVLLVPSSAVPELLRSGVLAGGLVVWSLWPGYLHDTSGKRLKQALDDAGIPLVVDHASGHAPVADLQRLAGALKADRLVPIHTEGAARYGEYFPNVELHDDNEWWTV